MNRVAIGLFMMALYSNAIAGDAENITACVNKASAFANVSLDEFGVDYEGNWFSMSTAKWSNAYCEVKLGEVYELTVNGEIVIYDGFAGKESFELNKVLWQNTDSAINTLQSRIVLLKDRMEKATNELKKPMPDRDILKQYVGEGIYKSTECNNEPDVKI